MNAKAAHEQCEGDLECETRGAAIFAPVAHDRPNGQYRQNQKKESNYLIPQDMDWPNNARQHETQELFSLRKHAGIISVAKLAYLGATEMQALSRYMNLRAESEARDTSNLNETVPAFETSTR